MVRFDREREVLLIIGTWGDKTLLAVSHVGRHTKGFHVTNIGRLTAITAITAITHIGDSAPGSAGREHQSHSFSSKQKIRILIQPEENVSTSNVVYNIVQETKFLKKRMKL